jgi:SAM-dependent methyltransferase
MLQSATRAIKSIPVLGPLLTKIRQTPFTSSSAYWETRYKKGHTSGAGSYGRLAMFKADFLNGFVRDKGIRSVIDFGCGDGNQLKISQYPSYTGVDVSMTSVNLCRGIFAADPTKKFVVASEFTPELTAELAISLDVIYHLVEDEVFDAYMRRLFASARRFVIVYSSDFDSSSPAEHVRQRNFTAWVRENAPHWKQVSFTANPYPYDESNPAETSFADFYVFAPVAATSDPN